MDVAFRVSCKFSDKCLPVWGQVFNITKAGREPATHRGGFLISNDVIGNLALGYEDPSVGGAEVLGPNSWIDLSGETPKLLD
jgi:hypothetical protein